MLLTLLNKQPLVDNIWAFRFHPAVPLSWLAGQFIKVELLHDQPDEAGPRRRFTITSPPQTGVVQITTRLTGSSFKRALAQLEPNETLRLVDEPAGDFIWRDWPKPLIFVAQGIGITPFYSILEDRRGRGLPLNARLLYANRPGSGHPFAAELEAWSAAGLEITHRHGVITPEFIVQSVPNLREHLVYLSGPGSMMKLLGPPTNLPVRQLKQDFFPGYSGSTY